MMKDVVLGGVGGVSSSLTTLYTDFLDFFFERDSLASTMNYQELNYMP